MRIAKLGLVLALWPIGAQAGLLSPGEVDASSYLPPPPAAGSAVEKRELKELHAIAARSRASITGKRGTEAMPSARTTASR